MSKQKKVLAGPAGDYLREFEFDHDGLVGRARIEFGMIAKNPSVFRTLNPHLVLTITSVKTLDDAKTLGQIDLGSIWFVDFGWITGTHGGMALDDKKLALVAPGLRNVRHLQLSARGTPAKCFSPRGVREVGQYAAALRYLAIDLDYDGMPPAAEYAARIADANFGALRALDIAGLTEIPGRPHVKVGTRLVEDGRFSDATEN
jgi:hypothetical protein